MKDKKTRLVEKSARVDVTRPEASSGLEIRRQTGVQNIPLQRCEDFDTAYRQQEHKTRRKNGEKSGTPNGSTGAARFSNGTGNAKTTAKGTE